MDGEHEWDEGDRVLAPWEPYWLYPATVRHVEGEVALVEFDDGDRAIVGADELEPIELAPGGYVAAKPDPDVNAYLPASVEGVDGESLLLRFKSGVSGWFDLKHVRVAADPSRRVDPAMN